MSQIVLYSAGLRTRSISIGSGRQAFGRVGYAPLQPTALSRSVILSAATTRVLYGKQRSELVGNALPSSFEPDKSRMVGGPETRTRWQNAEVERYE